jgi:hypothetical protein
MDEKGDKLELTIVFKGITSDDYVPRGIDVYILEQSMANQVTNDLKAELTSIYMKQNFTDRLVIDVENPGNTQMSVLFFNRIRGNDTQNDTTWKNAAVDIRIDYDVFEAAEDEGLNFIPILIAIFIVIIVLVGIVLALTFFKRRNKDVNTFFSPTEAPFYAFKSILDGKIYYLDPDQYAKLYNSNSLDEYDFLGTATRIGGTIMPPDDVAAEAVSSMPMEGQMMTAVPIEGGQPPVDIANMEAQPIDSAPMSAPEPVENDQPSQMQTQDEYENLYGDQKDEGENAVDQDPSNVPDDIPMNGIPESETRETSAEEKQAPPEDAVDIPDQTDTPEGSPVQGEDVEQT